MSNLAPIPAAHHYGTVPPADLASPAAAAAATVIAKAINRPVAGSRAQAALNSAIDAFVSGDHQTARDLAAVALLLDGGQR